MGLSKVERGFLSRVIESAEEERFAVPHVDDPPIDRQRDPIQPSACDLREIFLGLYDGVKGT